MAVWTFISIQLYKYDASVRVPIQILTRRQQNRMYYKYTAPEGKSKSV